MFSCYIQAVGSPWTVNPRWRTLGAPTEKAVQKEALKAWVTARVSKEQRRQTIAKRGSGNLTGLVSYTEFHNNSNYNIHKAV